MRRKPIQGDECQQNLIIGCVALIILMADIGDVGISSVSQDKGRELVSLSI
jgi:hypothetical protein